jgi:hypothetical protein
MIIMIIIIVHMTIIVVYLAVELHRCAGRTQRGTASLRVKPQLTAARCLCGCANSSCCGGAAAGAALVFPAHGLAELHRGGHGGCSCSGVAAGEHLGVTPALKQKAWLWDHRPHIVRDTLQRADVVGHVVARDRISGDEVQGRHEERVVLVQWVHDEAGAIGATVGHRGSECHR